MPGKLDVMADARDFIFQSRPRVKPMSSARRMDQIARQSREASVSAATSGGGSASSVPIFDVLPDPTAEDVGTIIYVAGASGQPAQGYIGVQTQDDRVIWEPIFTQALYGAATDFLDEFYNTNNWIQTVSAGGSVSNALGAFHAGHPGNILLRTNAGIGDRAAISLGAMGLSDIDRAAFIFRTGPSITSTKINAGFPSSVTAAPPNDGVYLQIKSTETVWKLCKAIAGVETRISSAILGNITNNWYLFQVEYTGVSGEFLLTITDLTGAQGADSTVVTGLNGSVTTFPIFYIESAVASARDLLVDYFFIRHRATVRS